MDKKYIIEAEKAYVFSALKNFCDIVKPGQEIILWGNIAMFGTVYMAEHKAGILSKKLPSHFIETGKVLKEQINVFPDEDLIKKCGITALYNVGEGGILKTLNDLSHDSKTGFYIDYDAVSLKQVTIEFCEVFELNPWQLMSGGCVLMITDSGYKAKQVLKKEGIPLETIGYITEDFDKLICHGDIRSCLNRPNEDEIFKL